MSTLTQDIRLKVSSTFSQTADLSIPNSAIAEQYKIETANGTSAGQADLRWRDAARTLAASASEDLDLAGGITDEYGNTLTFVELSGIIIKNNNETAGDDLLIGGAASNAFVGWFENSSDIMRVKARDTLYLTAYDGWTVTAGTGDKLKLANADATNQLSFDIILWGRSA